MKKVQRHSRRGILVLWCLSLLHCPETAAFQNINRFQAPRHALWARSPKVLEAETVSKDSKAKSPALQKQIISLSKVFEKDGQEDQAIYMKENDESSVANLSDEDGRRKYIVLGLLWMTACLAALDRVAMSIALVPMSAEFDFSSTVKGSISSVFSLGYGLFILPAGLLVANLSPRLVMVFGVALWSIATIFTPTTAGFMVAAGMIPLFIARACVGAGESILIPASQRFLLAWTSPEEKSRGEFFCE